MSFNDFKEFFDEKYCYNHSMEYTGKLKNGYYLYVCYTCGLHIELKEKIKEE